MVGFDANIDQILGAHLRVGPGAKPPSLEGSVGTEYFAQDRMTLVSGHLPDLADPGQAVMNAQAGKELGIHVGSTFTVTLNSDAQLLSGADNPPAVARATAAHRRSRGVPPGRRQRRLRHGGDGRRPRHPGPDPPSSTCAARPTRTARCGSRRATGGGRVGVVAGAPEQAAEPRRDLAAGAPAVGLAEQAIEPESIALAVFGALAALAALVIVSQIIGRQRRVEALELETLRALGAGPPRPRPTPPSARSPPSSPGRCCASVVAFFLSPLFPLGPVRPVYPYFFGWDWTVLGLGFLAFVVILSTVALGLALRMAPERVRRRSQQAPSGPRRWRAPWAHRGCPRRR